MTVFKAFWNVIKKYKGTIILYTVILIAFGGINQTTNNEISSFEASKPDILIVNSDEEIGITKNLIEYLTNNSNIIKIENNEEARNDALFYRDVNYIIYIPKGYRDNVLKGNTPIINIKSSGDYLSSLAEMMLKRYIKTQDIYIKKINNETELINNINKTLNQKSEIEVSSNINRNELSQAASFFNFASYSIMAVIIFIICLVLFSFNKDTIKKRTIISSTNYKKYNKIILLSSSLFALFVCIVYILLGVILLGKTMFSIRGIIFILNIFTFSISALTLALVISNIINSKEAISGIVNVVALGSAFLCGAFIPTDFLPDSVLKFSHILPAYWYINSNELLKSIEIINLETLKPIFINNIVIILFAIFFIIINNIITRKKRVY